MTVLASLWVLLRSYFNPRAHRADLAAEIAAFAGDPNHPHFSEVRSEMGALLKSGAAASLTEAYTVATVARGLSQTHAFGQIAVFAADPDNRYFGIVRQEMSELIRAGVAVGLSDAYQLAIQNSPEVRMLENARSVRVS